MPIITLYGLPSRLAETPELEELVMTTLPNAVASIKELGIAADQVTTFVPRDMLSKGLGNEVIAFIEGLFQKEERTPEVKQRLADTVKDALTAFCRNHIRECGLIEVIPRSQRPNDGFAHWEGGF